MNYLNHRLMTFRQVAELYEGTKPLVSKSHTREEDVRPIDNRRRKYERIWKVSDTKFAFLDGTIDYLPHMCWYNDHAVAHLGRRPPTRDEVLMLAPIIWTIAPDGTETVRVRNGSGPYPHCSRYKFLERFLPRGLPFNVRNGKQYVNGLFLPKSSTCIEEVQYTWRTPDYGSFRQEAQPDCDDKFLKFHREGDAHNTKGWYARKTFKEPKVVVDKDRKAAHKQDIAKFWDFICTMVIMLPTDDREYYWSMQHEIVAFNNDDYLAAITNDESEYRLNVGVQFAYFNDLKDVKDKEDLKVLRSKFNSFINNRCGFKTHVLGE